MYNKNKRFFSFFIFLASLLAILAACNSNPTAPGNKIRIGIDATLPPFESVSSDNKNYSGFDIDLMRAIAANAGLDVEFVNLSTNQLLTGVLNCTIDGGISAIPISDQLKQQMAFSDPYLTVEQVVVVKKSNITITGRDQLSGMVVVRWGIRPPRWLSRKTHPPN
jgi:polar amino acid transport system substrate-binding protein